MNRDGFALLTVLWLITALSAVVGLSLTAVSLGQRTTINRITLARGRWAAEACLAIAEKRWSEGRPAEAMVDLGRGTRCAWRVSDPGARINVNTASGEMLRAVAGDDFATVVLRRRANHPFVHVEQLAHIPGFARVAELVTVEGTGTINITAAAPAVLRALPGITPEAVARIEGRRSLDELAAALSHHARAALLDHYADLARLATFAPQQLIVTAEGWIDGESPRATIEILAVPLQDRLAVIRRRMW